MPPLRLCISTDHDDEFNFIILKAKNVARQQQSSPKITIQCTWEERKVQIHQPLCRQVVQVETEKIADLILKVRHFKCRANRLKVRFNTSSRWRRATTVQVVDMREQLLLAGWSSLVKTRDWRGGNAASPPPPVLYMWFNLLVADAWNWPGAFLWKIIIIVIGDWWPQQINKD